MPDSTTSICCTTWCYNKLYDKSTTIRSIVAYPMLHYFDLLPTASPQQKSTTSCGTNSKSCNKLDNLSHSKSTTYSQQVLQQSTSLTASRTTCCTTNPHLIEVMESDNMRQQYAAACSTRIARCACGSIVSLLCVMIRCSGRRMRLRDTTELSSFDTASRSDGSFLPRLRPVRIPATREDLRHDCTYAMLLRRRMHEHTSVRHCTLSHQHNTHIVLI